MERGLHAIVADDDLELLEAVSEGLEHAGMIVRRARSGAELIEALGERRFDLVVTDISMPWMSGLQALHATRYAGLTTPVVVITALRDSGIEDRVSALGGRAELLRKPFSMAELETAIAKLLSPIERDPSRDHGERVRV